MAGIYFFGSLLIVVSAALLAAHYKEWKAFHASPPPDPRDQTFESRKLRRRSQASALIGFVGLAMIAADSIPKNEYALSVYLFGLIIATLAILGLAISDLIACRFRRFDEDRKRLSEALRDYSRGSEAKRQLPIDD